ncbi:hypothetical protein COCMIDRAFT_45858, partial [Bipolaris oryzae ATCC 44560]
MTVAFHRKQLDRSRREIRLLELLPKTQWPNNPQPACRIFHASLDQHPSYRALSYVWGDKSDTRHILVNGRTFEVTRNLFEALNSIVESESFVIWIDAICINQADDEEKGWQVALMGDIYRQTSEVIAWLGPSAHNSDAVLEHLDILGSISESLGLPTDTSACLTAWKLMLGIKPLEGDLTEPTSNPTSNLTGLSISLKAFEILLYIMGGFESHRFLLPLADLGHLFQRQW